MKNTRALKVAVVSASLGLLIAGATTALAANGPNPGPAPAACTAADRAACLLPFPNNYHTVADPDSETGLRVHFPADERTTYTAAAAILCADALDRLTPAAGLFRGEG